MTSIYRKLRSQKGASILLAFLLFLICGFVAAVTLGAAATNARTYDRQRKEQQLYLSVSSAAQLFRDSLSGVKFEGSEEYRQYLHEDGRLSLLPQIELEYNIAKDNHPDHLDITNSTEALASIMEGGFHKIYQDNYQYPHSGKGTVSFTGWESTLLITADQMIPVQATISLKKDGTITVFLLPKISGDADNSIASLYSMTITFKTDISNKKDLGNDPLEPKTCTHTVTIENPYDPDHPDIYEITSDIKHEIHTMVFTIGQGEIRKGK